MVEYLSTSESETIFGVVLWTGEQPGYDGAQGYQALAQQLVNIAA